MSIKDSIFALATPYAKSGVAIVRVSGASAWPALVRLTGVERWEQNHARYVTLKNPTTGETIDRGLGLFFKAPQSFTGEDVAELQVHGSLGVIRELLDALATMPGLRPAEPGEFSRRAFLNGKMDLLEAEGLADLIDAETPAQKSQAMRQMEGAMSGYFGQLREGIVHALAQLEAYIDFPDEEIPHEVLQNVEGKIAHLKKLIADALQDNRRGERLREGMVVAILGAPNAGKSSLLNRLVNRDAAIVAPTPGTTRDIIEIYKEFSGFPVIFADTAGLRESTDEIEGEGVRRALNHAENADLKLILFDASHKPDPKSLALIDDNSLIIINKTDIHSHPTPLPQAGEGSERKALAGEGTLFISAKTGEGIDKLLKAIEKYVISFFSAHASPMITRNRHRALLEEALANLNQFSTQKPLELACEELRLAATSMGKITGKIQTDELLDVIFREFCIGK